MGEPEIISESQIKVVKRSEDKCINLLLELVFSNHNTKYMAAEMLAEGKATDDLYSHIIKQKSKPLDSHRGGRRRATSDV